MRISALVLLLVALSPLSVRAYEREHSALNPDACLYLPTRTFTYAIAAPGSERTTGTSEDDAIEAAFGAWATAVNSCSDMQFVFSGRTETRKAEYVAGGANENVVIFREQLCSDVVPDGDPCWGDYDCNNAYDCWQYSEGDIAQPLITYDSSGKIVDADFELNAANFEFTTVDSPACSGSVGQSCVAIDVQSAMTFLVGRALGLQLTQSLVQGELEREVSADSRDGICAIYPTGAPTTQCDGSPIVEPTTPDAGTDAGTEMDSDAGSTPPPAPAPPEPTKESEGCTAIGGGPLLFSAALLSMLFFVRGRRSKNDAN